ncbi:MAG TPA: IPT/TIG domain-containing protein [Solirubrobacteraceae bacterium]
MERALSGARYALGADTSADARTTRGRARSPRRRVAALALALAILGALASVAAVAAASSTASGSAFVQAGNKLTATGEAPLGQLGASAALSGDGRTLIVGARKDDGGAAYVFVRNDEPWPEASWSQKAKLTPGEVASGEGESTCTAGSCPGEECAEEASAGEAGEECAFGASVAVSADGDTALVGDPSPTAAPGSAWVFTKAPDGSWSRTAVLVGDGSPHEGRFGRSVALSADGTTALVGDPSAANGNGEAWIFTYEGTTWKRQPALSGALETTLAHLGRSVALSGDGRTALVGGPGADEAAGAVWVFTQSGGSWAQQRTPLTMPGGAAGDHFGRSVALSSDGSTALVGAPDADGHRGAAVTLVRSETGFAQLGPRIVEGLEEEEGHFGASVALSGDASEALVGAPFTDLGAGTVTKLAGPPSAWAQASEGLGGTEASGKGWRGTAVALSSDGMVAAIGAPRDAQRTGAAWVFERGPAESVPAPVVTAVTPGHGPTAGGTKVTIKGANFNGATEVHFGTKAVAVSAGSPTEIETVTPSGAAGRVHVTVTTPTGVSAESRADTFLYEGPATIPTQQPTAQQGTTGGSGGGTGAGSAGVLGFAASAGTECRVSLAKTRLAVARYRSVAVRLVRTGSGPCRGSLALVYRISAKGRRFALRTIGTASFSIPSGRSRVVAVKLSKAGQRWLRAHHGNVGASLAIARVVPAPTVAQMASVRLSVKKVRRAGAVKR